MKSLTFPDVFVSSSVTKSNNRNLRLIAQTDCHFLTVVEDTFIEPAAFLMTVVDENESLCGLDCKSWDD